MAGKGEDVKLTLKDTILFYGSLCVVLAIVGFLLYLFISIGYQSIRNVEKAEENRKSLILKMQKENCVELGYIQGDFLRNEKFEYVCDGGKSYTLNFKIQGEK